MNSKKNVVLVLDKSGSMSRRREQTISDYNEYISGIKDENVNIALFTFNAKVQKVENARAPLSVETYVPVGNTALFDALAQAIYSVPECETALVVILSDGQENWSRYQKGTGLATLIADKKLAGWEFIFMGCEDVCIKDADTLQVPYFWNTASSWRAPASSWNIGDPIVGGHEIYCSTRNYLHS